MDRASALPYPSSRTLAAWWRHLQAFQPQRLTVGHCYVHRLEAAVRALRREPLDPLAQHLLAALALAPNADIDTLGARLHLPVAVLRHSLRTLADAGLAVRNAALGWSLAPAGRAALDAGAILHPAEQRHSFSFVERIDAAGQRIAEPFFVPLGDGPAVPWTVAEAEAFDPAWLQRALAAAPEWKQAVGFPDEVAAIESAAPKAESSWRHILLDLAERLTLALIATDADTWLGFATQAPGWTLHHREPLLRLPDAKVWPELAAPAGDDDAWIAWRGWCQQRHLPAAEVEACRLAVAPATLQIAAPERLMQRLHAAKSDAIRGDAWLLLGEGHLRQAVALDLRVG